MKTFFFLLTGLLQKQLNATTRLLAQKQQGRSRNKEEEGYEEESGGKRLQPIRARFLLKEEKEGKKAD